MVELRIELISFGTWVGKETLLVKLFCNLYVHGISIEGERERETDVQDFLGGKF